MTDETAMPNDDRLVTETGVDARIAEIVEPVIEALDMKPDGQGPQPLRKMAAARGVPVEVLITDLQDAIAEWRAAQPHE